jgi:hypothetical protein
MPNSPFVWLEGTQDARAIQLVKIGNTLPTDFGVAAGDIAYWKHGAALNMWLQSQIIPAIRDFSTSATASRDELQLDKTIAAYVPPTLILPPAPVAPTGVTMQTDFLEWCDTLYQKMKLDGLDASAAKNIGFLVPIAAAPTSPMALQPRITSIDTQPGGKVVVTTSRDNQKMVRAQLTLDTAQVLEKTLPNTRLEFALPVDRVHGFTARAIYTDKDGNDIGQWSDVRSDSSQI